VEIPRGEVKDSLPLLGKEFRDLRTVLAPFEPLAGEGVEDFKVRALASSNFQVYLRVAMYILTPLTRSSTRQKVDNIRKMRNDAEETELPEIVEQLEAPPR
jgi:hypothetical protein